MTTGTIDLGEFGRYAYRKSAGLQHMLVLDAAKKATDSGTLAEFFRQLGSDRLESFEADTGGPVCYGPGLDHAAAVEFVGRVFPDALDAIGAQVVIEAQQSIERANEAIRTALQPDPQKSPATSAASLPGGQGPQTRGPAEQ